MGKKRRVSEHQLGLGIADYQSFDVPSIEALSCLPEIDYHAPLAREMPSWKDARRVAIDVETRDPQLKTLGPGVRRDPRENYVCGIAFAIEDGPAHYLPIRHYHGDNCDWDVWSYVRDQIRDFDGELVGCGMGYDLDWIAQSVGDDTILSKRCRDVQVLDVLLYELHQTYSLSSISVRRGLPPKSDSVLNQAAGVYGVHPKHGMWKMKARYVDEYGVGDVRLPLKILRRQEREMSEKEVGDIWRIEQQVTPILTKIERRGIPVDNDHLDAVERMSIVKEAEYLAQVKDMTGVSIAVGDVTKSNAMAPALEQQGYVLPITPKTKKPSIKNDWLEKKGGKVGKLLLKAREWNKLRGTYVDQVRRFQVNGRIHCHLNQLRADSDDDDRGGQGVRYGRLSSTKPPLQGQPIRSDEFAHIWRAVYVPEDGEEWACSDWRQQEPRIAVHYAEILGLPGAKEFADRYRADPSLDIHQALTDMANAMGSPYTRKIIKNFVNGRLYGMGDPKLCRALGLPTTYAWRPWANGGKGGDVEVAGPEGQAVIDSFVKFAPWVAGLVNAAKKAARDKGYVWTKLRRRCHFEKGPDGKYWKLHKAFNRIGQGSAADQMKATLIEADKEGIPINLIVHDEFDFSCSDRRQAQRLRELQRETVKFNVPMSVDLEMGPNWADLEKIAA